MDYHRVEGGSGDVARLEHGRDRRGRIEGLVGGSSVREFDAHRGRRRGEGTDLDRRPL